MQAAVRMLKCPLHTWVMCKVRWKMHTTATTQGKIPAWHEIRSNMPAAITNMPAIDQTMNKETKLHS